MLAYATPYPEADAERYYDRAFAEQDADEAMLVEAEQQAPLIVLAHLQAIKDPGEWLRPVICIGALQSPDEIFCNAIQYDEGSRNAYTELMTSPAAQKLRQAMAEWFGRRHAMAIYKERADAWIQPKQPAPRLCADRAHYTAGLRHAASAAATAARGCAAAAQPTPSAAAGQRRRNLSPPPSGLFLWSTR